MKRFLTLALIALPAVVLAGCGSGKRATTTIYEGAAGITAINFALPASSDLFERVAQAVADAQIVVPPITRVSLEEAPAALSSPPARPASGKTVITI